MLTYNLEQRGNMPIYEYLYKCIRDDILDGNLKKDEALPSKRAMARHMGIGIITVANAYDQLVTEGFVRAEERRGYFVEEITDLPHTVKKTHTEYRPEPAEHEYFADFKANRIGIRHFPLSVWSRLMRKTLSEKNANLLKTVPYNGVFELRLAISNYLYRNRGMEVDPSLIIIGAGTEYLYSRLIQLLGRSSIFAIADPGYKKFESIARSYGNTWKYIQMDDQGIDVEALEDSGADVCHVSPANQFPTGNVIPITRRVELFEWANRIGKRYIIEDDYDSEFRYSGSYIPPMYTQDSHNKVIYMNTFSKTLVPSIRISYMILPENLMKRYVETMNFYSCTVSSFEQLTLAKFIEEGHFERHLNHMKNYFKHQRRAILNELRSSPLARISSVREKNAGTHFILHVDTDLSDEEVLEAAKEQNLKLSLYSDYGIRPLYPDGCTVIINYAAIAEEKIPEVVKRLCRIFTECQ